MSLWLTIIITFIFQEIISMNAILLSAYQHGYNFLIVTLIFFVATVFDVYVAYKLGKWVQYRFGHRPFVKNIEHRVQSFQDFLGERGNKMALLILGFINLNYVNAFLASWSTVPFKTVMTYLIIGDLLWYGAASVVVLGVSTYINPFFAIYIVMGLSVLFLLATTLFHKKLFTKHSHA